MFSNIGYTAFERDFALRRVLGDNVTLGADDVQYNIVAKILLQLLEPAAHFFKRRGIGDIVAENARVRACSARVSQVCVPGLRVGLPL